MEIHPQLPVFGGSLLAIFALSGLAWWLKLGGAPLIDSEDAARKAAGEVWDGFTVHDIALDQNGIGALVRDGEGRIMLIKRHGNRFAGRILTSTAKAHNQTGHITVDSGEKRFGAVSLKLMNPAPWVEAINALSERGNA